MFGGMTTTNFHSPQPNATNLRKNIFYYLYNVNTNTAPTASSQTVSAVEDIAKAITLSASDPEGNSLTYTVNNPSNGMLSGDAPNLTYTPNADFNGTDSFTFKVNDGSLDSNTATVTINVAPVNDAPVLAGVPPSPAIDEMVLYSFTAIASDVDSPAPQFSLISGPAGAAIDPASGMFTWTPTETQGPGIYNFTVRATDTAGAFDEENISIQVREVNVAPQIANVPASATINELAAYGFTATASDSDVPSQTLTFSLVGAPAGAGINASTGAFAWTPSEAQGNGSTYNFTVRVSDGVANTDAPISLTVNEVNSAPTLAGVPATQTGFWGNAFAFTATAGDPDLPANTLTFSLIGAPSGATINPSTGAFAWTPLSSQINSHTFTVRVTDNGSPSLYNDKSVTITVGKRPTAIIYTGDGSEQYSDKQALTAILTDAGGGAMQGNPLPGKSVGFAIGTENASIATAASGIASTNLILTQNPAPSYNVVSSFAGDGLYVGSNDTDAFDITQEDARIYYTGMTFVNTACETCGTAATTLSATIRDITAETGDATTDPFAGDIRNAKVTFVNRDSSNAPITGCVDMPVQLVSSSDIKTGTVTCNWTANIGQSDSDQFTIGIVVSNYYNRNASTDNAVVTVSKPLGTNFITGGGYLVMNNPSSSAGQYAGGAGLKTNFGFNVKYNNSGRNLQGKVNVIVRAADGKVYQIKGNSMDTLTVNNANPLARTAVFTSKANLTDITNPLAPISLGGGHSFQMKLTDKGEPGSTDTIGITLYANGSGALLFSSNWNGTSTIEQLLGGGNLQVR